MTDADRLACYGRELHGTHWQLPLARDLDAGDRTVRFWAAGERPIPGWVWGRLAALLRAKAPRCLAMAAELEHKAA